MPRATTAGIGRVVMTDDGQTAAGRWATHLRRTTAGCHFGSAPRVLTLVTGCASPCKAAKSAEGSGVVFM